MVERGAGRAADGASPSDVASLRSADIVGRSRPPPSPVASVDAAPGVAGPSARGEPAPSAAVVGPTTTVSRSQASASPIIPPRGSARDGSLLGRYGSVVPAPGLARRGGRPKPIAASGPLPVGSVAKIVSPRDRSQQHDYRENRPPVVL